MRRTISQRELRNDSGAVLRAVRDDGETFVVTTNGTPVAELRPLPQQRQARSTAEVIRSAAHLPVVDYARFRNDLDAAIDQDPYREERWGGE